jgi:hypothetical protein
MKHLVGKAITEKVPFMGDEVEVKKMTVGEILELQKVIAKVGDSDDASKQIGLLRDIIKVAVLGADELSDADFDTFPIEELNKLSTKVMELSGLGGNTEGN